MYIYILIQGEQKRRTYTILCKIDNRRSMCKVSLCSLVNQCLLSSIIWRFLRISDTLGRAFESSIEVGELWTLVDHLKACVTDF